MNIWYPYTVVLRQIAWELFAKVSSFHDIRYFYVKVQGLPEENLKRYRKKLKTLMKRNFLRYTTVRCPGSYDEYAESSSDHENEVSLKSWKLRKFLRVAIATVQRNHTKFCIWIALHWPNISSHYTVPLSPTALGLREKKFIFGGKSSCRSANFRNFPYGNEST